jgi:hypothetical protein
MSSLQTIIFIKPLSKVKVTPSGFTRYDLIAAFERFGINQKVNNIASVFTRKEALVLEILFSIGQDL